MLVQMTPGGIYVPPAPRGIILPPDMPEPGRRIIAPSFGDPSRRGYEEPRRRSMGVQAMLLSGGHASSAWAADAVSGTDGADLKATTPMAGGPYSAVDGAFLIKSNRAYPNTTTARYAFSGFIPIANLVIEWDLYQASSVDSRVGIIFRWDTAGNSYYEVVWRSDVNSLYLYWVSAGGANSFIASLGGAGAIGNGNTSRFRASIIGDTFRFYQDNVYLSGVQDTNLTAAGAVGIICWNAAGSATTGFHIKNFSFKKHLFLDKLTDTNGTDITSHTPTDNGTSYSYHPSFSGHVTIDSNRSHKDNTGNEARALAAPVMPSANQTVEYKLYCASQLAGSYVGVLCRANASADTHYMWRFDKGFGGWVLLKAVAGSYSSPATVSGISPSVGGTAICGVSISGSSTTKVNGHCGLNTNNQTTFNDSSSPITAAGDAAQTFIGAATSSTGYHISEFACYSNGVAGDAPVAP